MAEATPNEATKLRVSVFTFALALAFQRLSFELSVSFAQRSPDKHTIRISQTTKGRFREAIFVCRESVIGRLLPNVSLVATRP